ncbi:MAG: hypothetical protein QF786_05180, partial [Vicinamibacterales bacterium]|nr:hypothetical protein [Vicinamibacterales bacterium]
GRPIRVTPGPEGDVQGPQESMWGYTNPAVGDWTGDGNPDLILGTSLGSCLAMLTAAHEPLVKAAALNHISPYVADVVWEGLSTAHVRAGLDGAIDLDLLRRLWLPISPHPYIGRLRDTPALLVYARYDLSFPVRLSRRLIADFERFGIRHDVTVLPCGHYTTGRAPFKWMDGYALVQFLRRTL